MPYIGVAQMQKIENHILKTVMDICIKNRLPTMLHCGSLLGAIRHGGPIPWDTDVDMIVPYTRMYEFIDAMKKNLPEEMYIDCYEENKKCRKLFPRIGIRGADIYAIHVDVFPLVGIPDRKADQEAFSKRSTQLNAQFRAQGIFPYMEKWTLVALLRRCWHAIRRFFVFKTQRKIHEEFTRHCSHYPFDQANYVMNPCGHYGMKNVLPREAFARVIRANYAGFTVLIPEQYECILTHYYADYMQYPSQEAQDRGYNFKAYVNDEVYERYANEI